MQATLEPPIALDPTLARPVRPPRWVHGLAVLSVLAACPLLFLGAEVTTKGVGMVDPRGFRWPWEIFSVLANPEYAINSALVLELTHRLFAFLVGILAICLCVAMLIVERGRRKWLGVAALAAVAAQGLLGRYRVDLNALLGPTLAWVHGGFAQIVFATLVGVAIVTSRKWIDAAGATASPALRYWSIAVVLILYSQLLAGGMLRHQGTLLAARLHLLGAFVAAAGLVWLVRLAWANDLCRWPCRVALALLTLQVLLGVEVLVNWMKRTFLPAAASADSVVMHWLRSGHYVLGTMLFATTMVVMLYAQRHPKSAEAAA